MAKNKYNLDRENINPFTGKPIKDAPPPVEVSPEDMEELKGILTGLDKIGTIQQNEDPLLTGLDKLALNKFEGHRGRPGQVGGSLPRGAPNAPAATKTVTDVKFSEHSSRDLIEGIGRLDHSLKGFVAVYTEEQYAEMGAKVYLSDDKQSGFAIKPDGELISVYSTAKGRGRTIMGEAVRLGAKKLDCYEDPASRHLTQLYGAYGFKETNRLKWDDQYAPDGWDYEKFDNPDVVFMERE